MISIFANRDGMLVIFVNNTWRLFAVENFVDLLDLIAVIVILLLWFERTMLEQKRKFMYITLIK